MGPRATPSRCAIATATAARSPATGPRPNRPTAPSAGISASATPPNIIATGFEEIRAAWRRLAKANHPDIKPGDKEAAARFQMIQASYDVLKRAEERRASLSP